MHRYDIRRVNAITEQIEHILQEIRSAQAGSNSSDLHSKTEALEVLLEQYWEARYERKLKRVV